MAKRSVKDKLYHVFTKIVDIIYIGILWLLCSIPIITLGAASTAMYYSMVKCVSRGRGHITKEFFSAFRRNFKISTLSWLLFLFLIVLWFINSIARSHADPEGLQLITKLSMFLIIPVCIPLPWLFAYISRFDNSLGDTIKYAVFLSIKHFSPSAFMLLSSAVFIFISFLLPVLIPVLPGFCCLIITWKIEPVFKGITAGMESDANIDQWYNE